MQIIYFFQQHVAQNTQFSLGLHEVIESVQVL